MTKHTYFLSPRRPNALWHLFSYPIPALSSLDFLYGMLQVVYYALIFLHKSFEGMSGVIKVCD